MLVSLFILGCTYLPSVVRAIEYNGLMLTWLRLMPWSENLDLFWSGKLDSFSRSDFLILANQLEALCGEHPSHNRDVVCLRANLAGLISAADRGDAPACLGSSKGSPAEHAMFAALFGDALYANWNEPDVAIEMWLAYLPADALIERARALVDCKDYEGAAALLAGIDPAYVPKSPREKTHLAITLAKLALFEEEYGDFVKAEFYWRWAICQLPEHAAYYAGLGKTLVQQGRSEEAATAYRRAIQLAPDVAQYHVRLAQTLVRMGETEQAIIAVRRALELDPNNLVAQNLLRRLVQE